MTEETKMTGAKSKATDYWPLTLVVVAVLALGSYIMLTKPDQRSSSEKISDAIHALPQGVDKAEQQLESRTPGQKLGDDIKDAGDKVGDKIKEDTKP